MENKAVGNNFERDSPNNVCFNFAKIDSQMINTMTTMTD